MESQKKVIDEMNELLENKPAEEVLDYMFNIFEGRAGFSTSLGVEDQVILHMLNSINKSAYIFTLDTGRLFPETYDLLDINSKRYEVKISVYFPDNQQVERMVNEKGVNLFYESIENRQLCCHIRKIEPLKRAFVGLNAWVTGIRKGQSMTRKDFKTVEWDEKNGLIKVNPLIDWSEKQVWDFIHDYKVPYNKLHDKGFPSIGCQPCTRAIMPGEDIRAGRWWWENPETRECGLHKK
ncbi:MAG TPA: phosphoadenylyl-sulfate reductase [Lentimicrobium sp.]|nr:phosphoadenylyl-sulfate reductase [Lentimicrobium sp.]